MKLWKFMVGPDGIDWAGGGIANVVIVAKAETEARARALAKERFLEHLAAELGEEDPEKRKAELAQGADWLDAVGGLEIDMTVEGCVAAAWV